MIKNTFKIAIVLIITMIIMPDMVSAGTNPNFVCDTTPYIIQRENTDVHIPTVGAYGDYLRFRKYNTLSSDTGQVIGNTYCLSPMRQNAHGQVMYCTQKINPGDTSVDLYTQAYYVSLTKAWQELVSRGWITNSDHDRGVGVLFRWLSYNFGVGDGGSTWRYGDYEFFYNNGTGIFKNPTDTLNAFLPNANGMPKEDVWNYNTELIQDAVEVYTEAVRVGNMILSGSTYEELVASGEIWGDQWEFTEISRSTIAGENKEVRTISIKPKAGTTPPETIYWEEFTASCSNNACTSTAERVSDTEGRMYITVDKSKVNSNDEGIEIYSSYYDVNSSTANIMIIESPQQYNGTMRYQRFLVVTRGSATITTSSGRPIRASSTSKINTSSCSCETDTSGRYTGNYVYNRYENGVLVDKITFPITDTNQANQYSCPDASVCTNPPKEEKHICEIVDGQHYCEDGQPCDEDEYIKDCLCNPVVTVPSDCNNFDTASTETGYISDIATTDRNCNNSEVVNQVKQCVIDNDDATGESFEATNELSGNKYCKVWCSESYDFELPTAQYSTSGGYFTLSTTISGTRDCYVSAADDPTQHIDVEQFNADLTAAEHAVIDAYNIYSKWKSAASISSTAVTLTCTYSGRSCDGDDDGDCESCSSGSKSETGYEKSWSWIEYDYNGNPSSGHSDSYGPGTTDDGTCDCSIDAEANRDAEHARLYQESRQALINAINELNNIIAEYNSCTGVINNPKNSDLATVDASSTSTSSWDNDMQFNPTVDFVYDQDYMNQMSGKFKQISDDASSEYVYCSGNTDDEYNCQSGATSSINTAARSVLTCDDGGCSHKTYNISTAQWIQKSKSHEAEYIVDDEFSTYTQYGTIKVKWDRCNGNDCLWTDLPEGSIPVSLITETGVFPFKFTFGNIGQSNSSTTLGRLIGNNVSVLTEYNKLDDKYKCGGNVSATTDGGYVCHYLNNCPGCDFTCDDDNNCEFDDCDSGYCTLECPNCVFDGENANFSYRTVSLNNMFPNDREIGYNWSQTAKAEATLQEIENAGESIYEEPQYSYTLSPTNLRNIREYNDDAGSYTNSRTPESVNGEDTAVYCDNVTIDGKTYSVRCKSRFLDLIDSSGNEYATNVIRPDPDDNNSWTLFSDTQYCPNGNCLSDGLGPAWK